MVRRCAALNSIRHGWLFGAVVTGLKDLLLWFFIRCIDFIEVDGIAFVFGFEENAKILSLFA